MHDVGKHGGAHHERGNDGVEEDGVVMGTDGGTEKRIGRRKSTRR